MANLFGGKNSAINKGFRDVGKRATQTVMNPTKKFSQVTGIKLPDKIRIGGTTIGTDTGIQGVLKQAQSSLRDLDKGRIQAKKDISNAERGEVGKFYGGAVRNFNNINPLYIAEKTARGQSLDKTFQKAAGTFIGGSYQSIANYAGRTSSVQSALRDENLDKNTFGASGNLAGYTRGVSTLTNQGNLSNEDRNDIIQGYTKIAAVATGAAAYSYLTAPATGAVQVAGGTGYVAPAVTSTEIATGVTTTYAGVGSTTAGASWLTGANATNAALAYTALTGKQAPTSIGDLITNPATQPDLGGIADLFRPRTGASYLSPEVSGDGAGAYGGDGVTAENPLMQILLFSGLALAGVYLYKRFA